MFSPYLGGAYGDLDVVRPYGFASTPTDGCEGFAKVGGDSAVVLGDLDASRPPTAKGELCLYDKWGNTITLTASGIVITDKSGNTITVGSTLLIEANGTVIQMTGGEVYLGVEKDPSNTNIVQVLCGTAGAPKLSKNVYCEKVP